MARGRPPGSRNKPKEGKPDKPTLTVVSSASSPKPDNRARPGHNSELNEDQKRALHFSHVGSYEKALERKKAADADLRNVAKTIKADGGSVRAIKLSIQLKTPEGEAKFKEEREEDLKVAAWNGLPIGVQGALFDVDRRPLEERAFEQGKNDGAQGITLKVPESYSASASASNTYTDGYKQGQALLGSKIKSTATVLRSPEAVAAKKAVVRDLDDADDALGAGSDDKPWPDDAQVAAAKAGGGAAASTSDTGDTAA